MVSAKIVVSAAVLLAASTVCALGNAVVQNQCSFEVYLWSVSNTAGSMVTVAAGGEYSESYKTNSDGGGVSIKLATDKSGSNVSQFEYTLESSDLWYDVSNINGYPFVEYGLTLIPSVSTCRSIVCPAGTSLCADAYNTPDENYATAECVATADTVLVLCSGDTTTSVDASESVVASGAVSTTAAAAKTSASAAAVTMASTTASYSSTSVHTTFVTTVVTVQATAAAATSATSTSSASEPWWSEFRGGKERRSGHIHRHAHAHGHQA